MSNNAPWLSIIIPCYNGEHCLPHILTQICAENLDGIEVIVINDGSTDGTENLCKSFVEKNEHIRFITTENHGVSEARNLGISSANGEYIAFFDADDEIVAESFDFIRSALSSNYEVCNFNLETYFINSGVHRHTLHLKSGEYQAEDFMRYFMCRSVMISPCTLLIKKTFLEKNHITFSSKMKFAEDYRFIFEVLFNCKKIKHEDSVIYRYLINENSVSNSMNFNRRRFEDCLYLIDYLQFQTESKKELCHAVRFFIADMFCANIQIYLQCSARDLIFERLVLEHKKILRNFIFGKGKYMLRILFFQLIPLRVLFLLTKRRLPK